MRALIGPIWERKWEILKVVTSLGVLLATAPVLVKVGSVGWEQGVVYSVAAAVDTVLPGNIDVPVVILAGVISAWLFLFALDSTKRIQTLLLIPVLGLVVRNLEESEHVVDAIGRSSGFYVGSFLVAGLVTGLLTRQFKLAKKVRTYSLADLARAVQFPGAAYWLYGVVAVIILVQILQYPFLSRSEMDPSTALVVFSGLASLGALSVFVKYQDERDIVSIAPPGPTQNKTTVYTFGGLYYVAKNTYGGTPIDERSKDILEDTIVNPSEWMQKGFTDGRIQFRFFPTNILRRSVLLSTENLTAQDIETDKLVDIGEDRTDRIRYHLWEFGLGILPESLREFIISQNVTTRLFQTDTVLLMVRFIEDGSVNGNSKQVLHVMSDLSGKTGTKLKLVITNTDKADQQIDQESDYTDEDYKHKIMREMKKNIGDEKTADAIQQIRVGHIEDVHPVSGQIGTNQLRGFDSLLEEL